ncbi:MAG TPA: hypothetical protein VKU38_16580, partial [Ktedonobacteraceae bacterium]|nr:hypothetical protein [Ktedonobacteraceae bacterium]
MRQLKNDGDTRQAEACAYCGEATQTRDHVPSRILLDEPFPENLPVVPACLPCNNKASFDEEYLACLIECVICGTTDPARVGREKIRRTLAKQHALQARLTAALRWENEQSLFNIELDRVERIVVKLAQGHALYELNEPQLAKPSSVVISPLGLLDNDVRGAFENTSGYDFAIWPEVGSRAMQRLVQNAHGWLEVQLGRYRYLATTDTVVRVRLVLS